MKVIYAGRASRRRLPPPDAEGDVIEVLSDNWDDYGHKTTFYTTSRADGELLSLGSVKILIDGQTDTVSKLDKLLSAGWDGLFPIPDINYISTPSEISFYEQLEGALGSQEAISVAIALRDASYLIRVNEDQQALLLTDSPGFRNSLQRERGSQKAYLDGWRVLTSQATSVADFEFSFTDAFNETSKIEFKFSPRGLLPHDINVLIGPNGSGKSRLLHQMVDEWIAPSKDESCGFSRKLNLSQLVVISYSPFEIFPVDIEQKVLQDKDAYKYFGLRGRGQRPSDDKPGAIRLSRTIPKINAAKSLVSCLSDDRRYKSIRDWAQKTATMESVLRSAIDFDFAAVEIPANKKASSFYVEGATVEPTHFDVKSEDEKRRFIPISPSYISELDDSKLAQHLIGHSGVTFFSNGDPIELSSGQRLFAYIVINLLGSIRRNSLILVDEPELFLHPTLEIQFVDMLKKILYAYDTKAILATHSVVTVREVPADCVHVFEKTKDGLVLKNPPFQTFGGDFQRISSYVFGDKSVSKPFERWIKSKLKEYSSADELISALSGDLNEELIMQIKAMEGGQW